MTAIPLPMKCCSICGGDFPATPEFFSRNPGGAHGLRAQCIPCRSARVREQIKAPAIIASRKALALRDRESGAARSRKKRWVQANPEKVKAYARKSWLAHQDKRRESDRKWRADNRDKVRAKQKRADAKLQQSPAHVLKKRIKARIRAMLQGKALGGTEALLGYTRAALVSHIERQFTAGMTWEALMRGGIHIDHILPVASFKITGPDCPEFKACWALSNLRPLWALDNQKKQAKVETLL